MNAYMARLEWNDRFSVSIPGLDEQHREIFHLLNDLRDLNSPESDLTALEKLIQYAENHLRKEELILHVRGFPGYSEHKEEHDEYRAKLADMQASPHQTNRAVRLANFLALWWRHHIMTSDQKYAAFFRNAP
jgi:hemerythrin